MAENLTPQPNIEIVRDLLSPYLDDEVTEEERVLVDDALADSPELRDELESLRQTVALVADLPRVAAPRPFTLTEADVQSVTPKPKKSFGLPAWFGGFAAAAALLVCVLAMGGLFWTNQLGSGGMVGDIAMAPQQAAMEQPAAEEPAPAEEEAAEEIAPAEEVPMEEAAEAELLMDTVEVEKEAAKEVVVEEKAEEAPNLAPAPAEATDTVGLSSDTDMAGTAGEDRIESQVLSTPTPAPLSTNTPPPSPTLAPPAAPGVAGGDTAFEEMEESAVTEGEAGAAEVPGDSIPDEQDDLAQRAEIQPTATAIALLTLLPPETPEVTPAPPELALESQTESFPYKTPILIGIVFILIIVVVIAMGVVIRRGKK
jgi:anti-sigma factor RsiW